MLSTTTLSLVLTALATLTTAQSTPSPTSAQPTATGKTVKLFIPGSDQEALVASVVGADASATTYAVACASGTDSNECGMPPEGMTITQGPATVLMSAVVAEESDPVAVTYGWECSIGGTTTAECEYRAEISVTGSADASVMSEYGGSSHINSVNSTTLNAQDMKTMLMAAVVTAGEEKLTQTQTGTQTGTPSETPGAATNVQVGGWAVGGALMAVFML